jgi:hypothetical protein
LEGLRLSLSAKGGFDNVPFFGSLSRLMPLIVELKNRIFFVFGALFVAWFGSHGIVLGQTWSATPSPTGSWSAIASSADGTKLVAADEYHSLWTSPDSGITWSSSNSPVGNWMSVASSADGNKLVAVAAGSGYGGIYTSTNSGGTWLSNDFASFNWYGVASSADGNKLLAVAGFGAMPGLIWTSTDAGGNWTTSNVPGGYHAFTCAASSADGKKLIIGEYYGHIYTSTNYGMTWRENQLSSYTMSFNAVASSADGSRLVAVVALASFGDGIFVSSNSGASWSSVYTIKPWSSIASSADGTKLVATSNYILTSFDSGITWTANNSLPSNGNYFVGSSADGNRLWTGGRSGQVYTSYAISTPKLYIIPAVDGGLVLSWLIPSRHFDLQRNSDLKTTNWITVTNLPVLNLTNLHQEVALPSPMGNAFYRLAAP